ncbi:MAG: hypothetical protein GY696_20855 [Gammaproteobacteria bacterium]|nr:hypothetical protein [Gammaproteobacteria bacterium]
MSSSDRSTVSKLFRQNYPVVLVATVGLLQVVLNRVQAQPADVISPFLVPELFLERQWKAAGIGTMLKQILDWRVVVFVLRKTTVVDPEFP